MPTWMSAIDSMTVGKGIGLGFLLSAVNPKNLLMAVSAGLIVAVIMAVLLLVIGVAVIGKGIGSF